MRSLPSAVLLMMATLGAEDSTLRQAGEQARRSHHEPATLGESEDHDDGWLSMSCDLGSSTSELSRSGDGDADASLAVVQAERSVLITTPQPEPEQPTHWRPAAFPYADGRNGWMVEVGERRGGVARLTLEAAGIERDLVRSGLTLRAYLPASLELDLRGSWYHEALDGNDANLYMGVADLCWRVMEGQRYAIRLGAGARLAHDDQGGLGGYNLNLGIDSYPLQPLVLSAAVDVGSLGSATVLALRAGVGCQLDRFAIEVGWERTSIGDVALDGPFAALSVSF